MKQARKSISQGILLLLILSMLAVPVSANSAQTHWRGTDITGAIIAGESCPITLPVRLSPGSPVPL